MARPRRPAKRKPVSDAYAKRDARARELGYKNYYDYRAHDNGRLPPSKPRLKGDALRRARGHVGETQRFLGTLSEGDLIIMPYGVSSVERDRHGRYVEIVKQVTYASGRRDRTFTLRNLSRAQLVETIAEEQRRGAIFSPAPSLDQRRLVTEDESEGGY